MLKIKIELYPYGREVGKQLLGEGYIINDGSSSKDTIGNYDVILKGKGGRKYKQVKIKNFQRKKYVAWRLLYEALKKAQEK